mmetsp:Transcript_177889/g.564473  ORF Transcript_177889/g.564473 Transcript_177889/m.564473 type:complete len:636 (+) Transcript_177889:59-1966(+)
MPSVARSGSGLLLAIALSGSARGGELALPRALTCRPGVGGVGIDGDDLRGGIQRLMAWATQPEDDPSAEAALAAECTLGTLVALAERGEAEDDQLLLLVARSPGLILLADLAQLASSRRDLALDPWLREFCRGRAGAVARPGEPSPAWCSGRSFGEVLLDNRVHWESLGGAIYRNLQPVAPGPASSLCVTGKSQDSLRVSVLGTHSGLSMAVAAAFTQSLREGGKEDISLAYFGHWAWCQNVANCEEPLAEMFRAYQQDWAETEAENNAAKFETLVVDLRRFLGAGEPQQLIASDLLLCTRPFLFCWLLRDLWPEGQAQLPMLHYYSGPLLFDVPVNLKEQVLLAFRRTVLESELDLVVSSSALQSTWMMVMAGVAVPHVRPHAAQLRGLYEPPANAPEKLRALVLRSTWIQSPMGESFRAVLAKVLRANSLEGRLEVDWLLSGKFYEYEDIARFHAAVFLPEQPDKLTFWEQYEMSMPLWLPTADFWVRIHAIGEHRYSVFAHLWEADLPEGAAAAEACGLPAPLFLRSETLHELPRADSPVTAALWFYLTDHVHFPHLQLFGSAAELVSGLLSADLAGMSRKMDAFNAQTWRASSAFYRAAHCILSGERGRPATPRFAPQPGGPAEWSRMCGA